MGKTYTSIDPDIQHWISQQHMFFVATAPLAAEGLVNLSPKGHDTLRVIDEHTLAFLDYGGSGIETVAHLRENQRIVIMMCAVEGAPKIYRFHGRGQVITPVDDDFGRLAQLFDRSELGIRSIIRVNVGRVSDSCGFGVPFYDYQGERPTSPNYIRVQGAKKIRAYLKEENSRSLDGLPGLSSAEADAYEGPINGD
ncbi:MAG: pyridoxamine 5'-phosphate oxidase family protein [Gammaproteobacteria bacterium]